MSGLDHFGYQVVAEGVNGQKVQEEEKEFHGRQTVVCLDLKVIFSNKNLWGSDKFIFEKNAYRN